MTNSLPSGLHTRNATLDIAKVIAVACVLMVHSCANYISEYAMGSLEYTLGNLINGTCRIAVPLFVMTSGALLLDEGKPFSLEKLFRRRILQTLVLLCFWSGVYVLVFSVVLPLRRGEAVDLQTAALDFVLGHYHMWYLFMQIGLYLALPFLRCFVRRENKDLVALYIGITMAVSLSTPVLKALTPYVPWAWWLQMWLEKFELGFFSSFVAYFLAGWYIVHIGIPQKKHRRWLYLLSVLSVAAYVGYVQVTADHANGYNERSLLVFVYSAGFFLWLNNGAENWSLWIRQMCGFLARHSFGIYIVHVLVLKVVSKLQARIPPLAYLVVGFPLVFGGSLLVSWILSKIPVLKKTVRG